MHARGVLIIALAALSISFGAKSASADQTFNLGSIAPGDTSVTNVSEPATPPSFTDTFNFSLSATGSGAASFTDTVLKLSGTSILNIGDVVLSITGPAGFFVTSNIGGAVNFSKDFTITDIGAYTATISGNTIGTAGGNYTFAVTAPVPEPHEWALLMTGLLILGFYAMRKRTRSRELKLAS